ncbi:Plasmodium exported protein, unknown function [Plasmodium gonderi]|uniref:Variable surface protein n=1 Tax=Plasmodium gonderi TaxID=77519 RepID=A0A1Y1JRK5_PLAGO|nr:Plasmodium exported protein, unknown function [Plasmodium gonderi]GAW84115.1 Plasmodium exported protein, unknown function [Plasmodium gonderi]
MIKIRNSKKKLIKTLKQTYYVKKKKSFSDYEECKFKTYGGKQKHFMGKFRIYLPPTVLMAILMIMMIFKDFFNVYIFAFLSMAFFAIALYYAYKFTEINRMNELYKSFSNKINSSKKVK